MAVATGEAVVNRAAPLISPGEAITMVSAFRRLRAASLARFAHGGSCRAEMIYRTAKRRLVALRVSRSHSVSGGATALQVASPCGACHPLSSATCHNLHAVMRTGQYTRKDERR